MIRFSAALVAVAIGVLIGGIATSKLLLVYIAIAVSAVALVALAVGVALKREELFGEGQGLAPAQPGAGPVTPARAGESFGQGVTPPPLQGAAVGPGAAFAGHTTAASAPPGVSWGAPAASGAWPSPAAPAAPTPAMWQSPPVPAGAAGGWGTPSAPAATSGGGAGAGAQNWFNPAESPVSAGPPDTAAPDEGEDWPSRYSWLDDEPDDEPAEDGAGTVGEPGEAAEVTAGEPDLDDEVTAPAALRLVRDPEPAPEPDETAQPYGTAEPAGPAVSDASAGAAAATGAAAGQHSAAPAAAEPGAAGLVTVVRGVPRFHQQDCVLIRFMPEGDVQQLTVAAAEEAGCTPCAACQPE